MLRATLAAVCEVGEDSALVYLQFSLDRYAAYAGASVLQPANLPSYSQLICAQRRSMLDGKRSI